MRSPRRFAATTAMLGLLCAAAAHAQIPIGANAPNFTKSRLGGGTTSLNDYAGKVIVLFILGYA